MILAISLANNETEKLVFVRLVLLRPLAIERLSLRERA